MRRRSFLRTVAELLPFGHGVMSGDPLPDRVAATDAVRTTR